MVKTIKSRRLRWAVIKEGSSAINILTGKLTGKPLRSCRRRWEGNIRMDLKEICTNMRNWVDSAQVRDYWRTLVNATLNLQVPCAMS